MSDALQGLHAAHEARDERGLSLEIVHRDVTPQNILVGVDGVGRLLDFGVAKAAERAQTTREGQIKGKLAYMAPEQLRSSGVTRQTDVYAASVVLWELLAGERLFGGGSEVDVIAKVLRRDIQPPSVVAPGIPKALDDIVMRGLSADVSERYASARELCVALTSCGVQEAAGITVGEWVEGLAKEALDARSAKIAAIESQPEAEVMEAGQDASAPPIPTVPAGRRHSPSQPTLSAVMPAPALEDAAEAVPEEANPAMGNALRRNVRARIIGGATVAACVVIVALAFARSGTRASEADPSGSAAVVAPSAPSPSPVPEPAVAAPPPPATEVASPEPAPVPSPPARPAAPVVHASAPAPHAAPVRPAHAKAPSSKGGDSDAVFDRRD